ncbi:MAG: HD domain-containing protein [bacterium]
MEFVDSIYDNIHGYIGLTELEQKIEQLRIFKRLKYIKQLGLASWIFPGAEHTRYTHSLGVMYIVDEMAKSLGIKSDKKRQKIRLAGLLHDIGHYPLSHSVEEAYKNYSSALDDNFILQINKEDISSNNKYNKTQNNRTLKGNFDKKEQIMKQLDKDILLGIIMEPANNKYHHENMSARIIKNSNHIKREILADDRFNEEDIADICDIITGNLVDNSQNKKYLEVMVQLMHSELDADRIDYLLRDAISSGTSYGKIEAETIIRNLKRVKNPEFDIDIVGIKRKGINSADQFLVNRFFAYSQVIFHKHVAILKEMVQRVAEYFISKGIFPDVLDWIGENKIDNRYYEFTDNYFMKKLVKKNREKIKDDIINNIIDNLVCGRALELIDEPGNPMCFSVSYNKWGEAKKKKIQVEREYRRKCEDDIYVKRENYLTKHVKIRDFRRLYKEYEKDLEQELEQLEKHRLLNGLAYIEGDKSKLLVDNEMSMLGELCRHQKLYLNGYEF